MAIQKDKTLTNGATGNYWKITREAYDKQARTGIYTLSLYCDKAHSDSKTPSLGYGKEFVFTLTHEQFIADRTSVGYALIKAWSAEHQKSLLDGSDLETLNFPDIVGGTDV